MSFELILPFLRPIEPLLLDESISEIMGNPDASWWSERDGILCRELSVRFEAARLRTGLEVIANHLGKKLDEDNPVLHAQLPDGSRLAAVIPPVVKSSPAVTIRKFTSRHYTVDDLIARGTLTRQLAEFLIEQIVSGKTLLISGGTGTGKTTLLRILAAGIPDEQRIVVIEDTSELHLEKPNILAVESQTDTFKASITFDDLLKSALRWRPDRIILGEVRGIEARTLLDSFNTGHAGSLATIHANSAAKALSRFANLVMRSHAQSTISDVEAEIGEAVDFVIHVERQPGRRIIREVLRLQGYDRTSQTFHCEQAYQASQIHDGSLICGIKRQSGNQRKENSAESKHCRHREQIEISSLALIFGGNYTGIDGTEESNCDRRHNPCRAKQGQKNLTVSKR
jgi:pilus assembly protein CpaF